MKKIFYILIIFSLFFCHNFNASVNAGEEKKVMVVQNYTNLYNTTSLEGGILTTIPHKTVLVVIEQVSDTYDYYKVTYNEQTGFVYANHCMDIELASPKKHLDYNAKIKSENASVYFKEGESFKPLYITLTKDTQVQILDGYDTEKEYTLISFIYEDISYIYYVKTNDIHADGISKTVIIIISIVITCISLILILFGVSFKKIKRKR